MLALVGVVYTHQVSDGFCVKFSKQLATVSVGLLGNKPFRCFKHTQNFSNI